MRNGLVGAPGQGQGEGGIPSPDGLIIGEAQAGVITPGMFAQVVQTGHTMAMKAGRPDARCDGPFY